MQLSAKDLSVVNALVIHFYDIVPRQYATYCSLTARIVQSVLQQFGIDAKLLPCQVWLVTDDHNFIVGFVGKVNPRKWDGHVVCRAKDVIIDAALKHFETEFGLNVPSIGSTPCFDVPTTVISRCDVNPHARFWWHYPPATPGFDLNIPEEPLELVTKYATQLCEHLRAKFSENCLETSASAGKMRAHGHHWPWPALADD